jgi:hypothetical protein
MKNSIYRVGKGVKVYYFILEYSEKGTRRY